LVAVANGLLHLRTRTLYPPTPRLFNFNALPVAYSPDSPPPAAWLAFLAQVWPNDAESIATLQEVFGYLLTTDTGQQKIFLIVGPKRSGKGTIARVLHALLGAANIAGPTLASLAGRFGLEPLVGKLAAVLSDARMSGRPDQQAVAENLLRISGEDQVEVDRKHRPSLTLRLGVRVVMLSNEVPRIADASGAMASRFIVLKMTESFYGREDPGLTARLLADLSGVFNWAIEGWHRLNARGYFAPPMSSAAAAQDLADLGSPVATFVREVCIVGAGAEVDSDQLFAAWRTWCTQEGIERAGTKSSFGRDLNSAVQGIRVSQPRDEGARLRVYVGIGLRPGTGWHGQLAIAA
jgi:putative DNA primase/helicase